MNTDLNLSGNSLTVEQIFSFLKNPKKIIELSPEVLQNCEHCFNFLQKSIENHETITYGVNTGFGPMASHILAPDQLVQLQKNLIYSHAVGMGDPIKLKYVLTAMVIRLNTLVKGYSGVSKELIAQLKAFIDNRIIPYVPEHGAVGTSGDLVQLAHIALCLIGEGQVYYKGELSETKEVLSALKLKPYIPKPKEGLSLINGTSMMTAITAIACNDAERLLNISVRSGALALELVCAYDDGISEVLHSVRPHPGQNKIAGQLRSLLASSHLLRKRHNLKKNFTDNGPVTKIPESVQEVYSLRCIAQILGPIADTLERTKSIVEVEMNSVTDNPVIDHKNGNFLHGGNFHGDYIASAVDQLKITLVKLTMLSERRINFFCNPKINGIFPPFLNLDTPGLTLGLQGLQFVATSTTSNSQTLAYPQYVHSIPTNGDNQDIVSMGTDAALIASKVIENAYIVLAIELVNVCQAVDYLGVGQKLSQSSKNLYQQVRELVPAIHEDRLLYPQLQLLTKSLKDTFEVAKYLS